jgi:uncharacterized cupredoxin-like copper-binding protein
VSAKHPWLAGHRAAFNALDSHVAVRLLKYGRATPPLLLLADYSIQEKPAMKRIVALGRLVMLILMSSACSSASPDTGATLTLEAKEFQFSPTTLEVVAGQPVKLTLTNSGTLQHDFNIMEIPLEGTPQSTGGMDHDMAGMAGMGDQPALHIAVMNGQSGTLEFTPTKPGTYEFWCTVEGHKDSGMVGSLVVTAP